MSTPTYEVIVPVMTSLVIQIPRTPDMTPTEAAKQAILQIQNETWEDSIKRIDPERIEYDIDRDLGNPHVIVLDAQGQSFSGDELDQERLTEVWDRPSTQDKA